MKLFNLKRIAVRITSVAVIMASLLPIGQAAAVGQLTNRSLALGSSAASASTSHTFTFTIATTANIGSIGFQYCTTSSGTCTMPTGLSTTSSTLGTVTGAGTGYTLNKTTNGAPYITHTAASLASGANVTVPLNAVTNPSTTNTTFYVRITTYTGTDGATGATDAGTVASSTANQITVTATVPESLSFCVYTGANCAAGGSTVALGTLSSAAASSGTSLFDVGTNASSGYIVTLNGTTLTSGSNTIAAYSAGTSSPGTSGFGINLRANTTPSVGSDKVNTTGNSVGTYGTGYGTANTYNFNTGDTIANSTGPSDNNTFKVSYVANISTAQAAGAYSTTLTYICTATF